MALNDLYRCQIRYQNQLHFFQNTLVMQETAEPTAGFPAQLIANAIYGDWLPQFRNAMAQDMFFTAVVVNNLSDNTDPTGLYTRGVVAGQVASQTLPSNCPFQISIKGDNPPNKGWAALRMSILSEIQTDGNLLTSAAVTQIEDNIRDVIMVELEEESAGAGRWEIRILTYPGDPGHINPPIVIIPTSFTVEGVIRNLRRRTSKGLTSIVS